MTQLLLVLSKSIAPFYVSSSFTLHNCDMIVLLKTFGQIRSDGNGQ